MNLFHDPIFFNFTFKLKVILKIEVKLQNVNFKLPNLKKKTNNI
jgi:hypothetical protein